MIFTWLVSSIRGDIHCAAVRWIKWLISEAVFMGLVGLCFSIIFSKAMPCFDPQSFSSCLNSCESLQSSLAPYLAELDNHNIDVTFGIVQELCKIITSHCDPLKKINALLAVVQMLQRPHYPFLLFTEVYLLPVLAKPIQFAIENKDFQLVTSFFQKNGHPINTPFIHNLSYNFVALACFICQLSAAIKPYRVYNAEEYQETSAFKRFYERMAKQRVSLPLSNFGESKNSAELRDFYKESLEKWSQYEDSLIYYFIQLLDEYLSSDRSDHPNPFCEMLQYGQSSITGQTIARLIDIITHHLSFQIRVRALKLFDKMILWGDVEALLVINFTENVEMIIRAFWVVKGEESLDQGRNIYPEISGQQTKKLEFYKLFLTCLQNWGISFPNHQFLILDESAANEPSPVYRLYKLLREKRNIIFPNNANLIKYETEARLAFLEKLLRNKLILKDINISSPQNSEVSLLQPKTYKMSEVQSYYQAHKQVLVSLISKKGSIYQCMQKLSDFRQHFEQMVEGIQLQEQPMQECDKLIEHGLELIEIVTILYDPYMQLLHNQINQKEFIEKITHACIKFFSQNDQEDPFVHFYSQTVAIRKESLLMLLKTQRSNPLERDLKNITNSLITKQFRHNYKLKLQKLSSSRNSERSEMCLEIFTRTIFTRQSREEMDKSIEKRQSKEAITSNKECLKSKDNVTGSNSLNSSREKKKLTVVSRQRMQTQKSGERTAPNENQVAVEVPKKGSKNQSSSETRSSRQQAKQPVIQQCLRIVNPLVSFQQNSHYFSYMPSQPYKFSYIAKKILIFKTPFLTIERSVISATQQPETVSIQFILTPHQYIPDFSIFIEDQECIKIDQQMVKIDKCLQPNRQYLVEINGQMRKIPLRMPTIAFLLQRKIIFQYILPFTVNFFLCPNRDKQAVLTRYRQIQQQGKPLYFTSPKLILSHVLFPRSLSDLPSFLQGSFLDESFQAERCIWEVRLSKMHFLFTFELLQFSHLAIKGYDLSRHDNYNESMLRYVINFFSHLLAERQA